MTIIVSGILEERNSLWFNVIRSFGQQTTASSTLFSQGGSGGFFSGLGSKPSPENANKNIFGSSSFGSSPQNTSE